MPGNTTTTASSVASEADTYEALVEAALADLAASDTEDGVKPVDGEDDGPTMAWFIATHNG